MLSYFLKFGDELAAQKFSPYIWEDTGLGNFIKTKLSENYGTDLELILIMYYVPGRFTVNGPEGFKVNNYSSKEKTISVAHTIPEQFWQYDEHERRQYIVESTISAVKLVKQRLQKRKINFDKLEQDLYQQVQQWLLEFS